MVSLRLTLCLCLLIFASSLSERVRFDGYKVIEVDTPDFEDVAYMRQLMFNELEISFWIEPSLQRPTTILVSPENLERVFNYLTRRNLNYIITDHDFQQAIDEEWNEIERLRIAENFAFDVNNYNRLQDIYNWLDTLVAKCAKSFTCKVYEIGKSHLGKPIKAFQITKPVAGRKSWYVDATTHAREWITTATITKIIDEMIKSTNPNVVNLLNKYNWYFVPVVNPDGYEHTWDKDRNWRKNMHNFKPCVGVDLNRNFNASNWGKDGTSDIACSNIYRGPSGGSEEETKAVSNEFKRLKSELVVVFTMHSSGNMYLIPFGHTYDGKKCVRSTDHDQLMIGINAAADATQATNGTKWVRGNGCEVIYPVSGSTVDLAKELGIKYCVAPELRGNGFIVPAAEIPISFLEIFNGIVALEKKL